MTRRLQNKAEAFYAPRRRSRCEDVAKVVADVTKNFGSEGATREQVAALLVSHVTHVQWT